MITNKELQQLADTTQHFLYTNIIHIDNWKDCPTSVLADLVKQQANVLKRAVNKTEPMRIPFIHKKYIITESDKDIITLESAKLTVLTMLIADRFKY